MHCRLIVALAVLASSIAHAGVLKDETDRFTGERSVKWSTLPAGPEQFSFSTLAAFNKDGTEKGYIAYLMTYSDRYQYSDCNRVYWLFDGQPAPDIVNDYKTSRGESSAIEYFRLVARRDVLERFAKASKVEFKVCNTESEISQEDLNGLRQVLKATQ